jgi:hypothetical protein
LTQHLRAITVSQVGCRRQWSLRDFCLRPEINLDRAFSPCLLSSRRLPIVLRLIRVQVIPKINQNLPIIVLLLRGSDVLGCGRQ